MAELSAHVCGDRHGFYACGLPDGHGGNHSTVIEGGGVIGWPARDGETLSDERRYITFDEMCWPVPSADAEWTCRYGEPTRRDHLYAASVIAAYRQLIALPSRTRNQRIAALRRGQ